MRTSELTGAALDWAVAKCNQDWTDEDRWCNTIGYVDSGDPDDEPYMPSEDWAQGGPIIELEGIELSMPRLTTREKWCATRIENSAVCEVHGPTPLIAAMRCFVASRLGDEVDIPEELV